MTYKTDVAEMVSRMYQETDRVLLPLYPWLLVRPLSRATTTQSGRLYLPEKQNKVQLESVVLAVWKPFWENVEKEKENGEVLKVRVWNESDLKPGDHIIHPHYIGLPDSYLDETDYRLLKEDDVIATLNYHKKDWISSELKRIVQTHFRLELEPDRDEIVRSVLENFDVVPKNGLHSLTLSGK